MVVSRRFMLTAGVASMGVVNACGRRKPERSPNSEPTKPKMSNPMQFEDGVALASKIKSGETTALVAVEQAIARAEEANSDINAIASRMYDSARTSAAENPTGPFGGVPSFIKDLSEWKGAPTIMGSRAFQGYVPDFDSKISAKYRAAGIIPIGKSTTPERGFTCTTEPMVTGPTRNPWNLNHSSGGSSGGAAALVAAGVVPFAHASDGGGSIRIPAAWCGLFGFKPSRGALVSRFDGRPVPLDISVGHALTWTVRDSAALFGIAQKTDNPIVTEPSTKRLKIGIQTTGVGPYDVDQEIIESVENTAELLRGLGHDVQVKTFETNSEQFSDDFLLYWSSAAARFVKDALAFSGATDPREVLEPLTLGLANHFDTNKRKIAGAVGRLIEFKTVYDAFFDDLDVWLTPVTNTVAPLIGQLDPTKPYDTAIGAVLKAVSFTPMMNVSGAPSMSVPLGMSKSGLPIGVMLSGKQGDDAMLMALAYELEEAQPWIKTRPSKP